ncbi:MAG: hypothetical protein J5911_04420 [Clostridia bacterium]|nr:hypothetical protein [Clostridia bacterium]
MEHGIDKLGGVAEWIWLKEGSALNQFAEFYREFDICDTANVFVEISAPTQYVLYINGKFVANGQYGDYGFYKVYDRIDIGAFVKKGKNVLAVLAYNQGDDSFPYLFKTPAITFCVYSKENVVAYSDGNTFVRLSKSYISGRNEPFAPPLGYTVQVDLSKDDGWKTQKENGFKKATVVKTGFKLFIRPILRPAFSGNKFSRIAAQGVFKENGGKTTGEMAQRAYLSSRTLVEMTGVLREKCDIFPNPFTFKTDGGDGVYIIVDLSVERVGYITFDIEVEQDTEAIISVGEHLSDGRVRAFVGGRNFVHRFTFKKGKNTFTERVRRIAGRYLMLYAYTDKITVNYLTIDDYEYPFKEKKALLPDALKQRIYDTGLRTLKVCFHEHYEDCPCREQSLYGQDSRNQMLFGYDAFEGTAPQKASLKLLSMANFTRTDGLIWSTAPGFKLGILPDIHKNDEKGGIPNFSLFWVLAVCEYYERTKDKAFVEEVLPAILGIMKAFNERVREKGIESFPHKDYFNFYEWSEGMEPGTNANTDVMAALGSMPTSIDCILTVHFAFISKKLAEVLTEIGKRELSDEFTALWEKVSPLAENFYDENDGYYYSYISHEGERYGKHECTQAYVLYCGAGDKARREKVARNMISEKNGLVRITLPNLQYKFDGIIDVLGEEGLKWVYDEIEKIFGEMCFNGYTTFPEMECGEKIFEDAASLCHGWSAIGCYIYNKYLLKR